MLKIYTIRDKKMDTHIRPMLVPHVVEIQRNLINVLKEGKAVMAQFPTDYELYYLGEWDEKHAKITLEDKPVFIMNISDLTEGDGKL